MLVFLPEGLLEVEFSRSKWKVVFWFFSKKIEFWRNCFQHVCHNCSSHVYWKFSRKQISPEGNSYHVFFPNLRGRFLELMQKKTPEFIKKSFIRVDKTAFFFTDGLFEKVAFCGKTSVPWKFLYRSKKIRFPVGVFLKILSEDHASFPKKKLRILFLWEKKYIFLLFYQTVPVLSKKYFGQCCQNFNLRVREKISMYFFPDKKNQFQKFFRMLSQNIPAFVEKLQAVLSKKLLSLPEEFFEVKNFLFKIKLSFLNIQQKL